MNEITIIGFTCALLILLAYKLGKYAGYMRMQKEVIEEQRGHIKLLKEIDDFFIVLEKELKSKRNETKN